MASVVAEFVFLNTLYLSLWLWTPAYQLLQVCRSHYLCCTQFSEIESRESKYALDCKPTMKRLTIDMEYILTLVTVTSI